MSLAAYSWVISSNSLTNGQKWNIIQFYMRSMCFYMDETCGCSAEWNKPITEIQVNGLPFHWDELTKVHKTKELREWGGNEDHGQGFGCIRCKVKEFLVVLRRCISGWPGRQISCTMVEKRKFQILAVCVHHFLEPIFLYTIFRLEVMLPLGTVCAWPSKCYVPCGKIGPRRNVWNTPFGTEVWAIAQLTQMVRSQLLSWLVQIQEHHSPCAPVM